MYVCIYSHQSTLYFLRIVIATLIITWSCQAKLSKKMRYFPPFANNNPIFYPSLIWLSAVGLYRSLAIKNFYGVASAKGYFHRCCYRQYLSILFPYCRATILSDTFGKGILCHRHAWFWTQSLYAKSVWFARLHCLYWGFQDPFLVWAPSLPGKYAQRNGEKGLLYAIYEENSTCVLLKPNSW